MLATRSGEPLLYSKPYEWWTRPIHFLWYMTYVQYVHYHPHTHSFASGTIVHTNVHSEARGEVLMSNLALLTQRAQVSHDTCC